MSGGSSRAALLSTYVRCGIIKDLLEVGEKGMLSIGLGFLTASDRTERDLKGLIIQLPYFTGEKTEVLRCAPSAHIFSVSSCVERSLARAPSWTLQLWDLELRPGSPDLSNECAFVS